MVVVCGCAVCAEGHPGGRVGVRLGGGGGVLYGMGSRISMGTGNDHQRDLYLSTIHHEHQQHCVVARGECWEHIQALQAVWPVWRGNLSLRITPWYTSFWVARSIFCAPTSASTVQKMFPTCAACWTARPGSLHATAALFLFSFRFAHKVPRKLAIKFDLFLK